jgi:hypothetical protein
MTLLTAGKLRNTTLITRMTFHETPETESVPKHRRVSVAIIAVLIIVLVVIRPRRHQAINYRSHQMQMS